MAEPRTCAEEDCERPSCMPAPYAPACAKHYIVAVKRAQQAAEARFQQRLRDLIEARR